MGGLAKGLAIIEAFSPRRTRMTVSEAAEVSGTSRASARRCLLTLTELGYLGFDGKYFRPQPRLLALSHAYSGTRSLPEIAQPFLVAARDELHESISLAVLDQDAALFVARAEAERLVTTGISLGTRIDLYCSATGRVLLAGLARRTGLGLSRSHEARGADEIRAGAEDRTAGCDQARQQGWLCRHRPGARNRIALHCGPGHETRAALSSPP